MTDDPKIPAIISVVKEIGKGDDLGEEVHLGVNDTATRIWCGPAMGAFNDWVRGTNLEPPENRRVADVALRLMRQAAYLYRVQALRVQGVRV